MAISVRGCEQQVSKSPSAGGSTGSGCSRPNRKRAHSRFGKFKDALEG
jgi:hypothetical protein